MEAISICNLRALHTMVIGPIIMVFLEAHENSLQVQCSSILYFSVEFQVKFLLGDAHQKYG